MADTTPTEPQAPTGQAATQPPVQPGQAPATTPPAAGQAPQAQPSLTPEQAAQLQSELAELRKVKQSYDELRPKFTQTAQIAAERERQLQAIIGNQPKVDPIAGYTKQAMERFGIDEESAKVIAAVQYENDQRFNALSSSIQARDQVPSIMQRVVAENPGLLNYPSALQVATQSLHEAAATGNLQVMNPDYALNIACIEVGKSQFAPQQNGNSHQAQQPVAFQSFTGPGQSLGMPQQRSQPTTNPQSEELYRKMQEHAGIPKKP